MYLVCLSLLLVAFGGHVGHWEDDRWSRGVLLGCTEAVEDAPYDQADKQSQPSHDGPGSRVLHILHVHVSFGVSQEGVDVSLRHVEIML